MRNYILGLGLAVGWFSADSAQAQFGQNNPQAPPNSHFLPRTGGSYVGKSPYGPFSNFQGYNNFGAGPFNPYGNAWAGGYGSAFQNNPWGGGYGYQYQYQYGMGANGFGYNNAMGYNGFPGMSAPFGGYQTFGGYNFSPIVGMNNGWGPYYPAYDPNNPVNQALQNLYIQGLTGSVTGPSIRR